MRTSERVLWNETNLVDAQESVGVGSQESQEVEGCLLVQEWGHIPGGGHQAQHYMGLSAWGGGG